MLLDSWFISHGSRHKFRANFSKKFVNALFFWGYFWEKKAYTALLQSRTFLCRKKWGPQRKDFGGGYGFPGYYRVFVSTTGLESFFWGQNSSPKDFLSVVVAYAFFLSVFLDLRLGFWAPSTSSTSSTSSSGTLAARIARCHRDVRCDSNRTPPNR